MAGSMAVLLIEDYEDDLFLFKRALNAVCPGVAFQSVSDAETTQGEAQARPSRRPFKV